MSDLFIKKLKGVIKLKIKGKHIERFIKRLHKNKIQLLEITYPKYNEVNIKILEEDFEKVKEIKTIYDIYIVDSYGIYKLKKILKINKILIIFLMVGFVILWFLVNTVFSVEIVHNDKNIRNLMIQELEENGLKIGNRVKNYEKIQKIKNNILEKYKDNIEWLEIERVGTKYLVRLEERKKPIIEEQLEKQNIISLKNAVIKKIDAVSGEIIKNINDYVKPGDIIISGKISLYDNVKEIVRAEGKVFGEVWYQTNIEHPFVYKEEQVTNKTKKILSIHFLNKNFDLFNFKPFKNKKSKIKTLFKNNWFPFSLVIDEQQEIKKIDEVYTEEQAINAALKIATKKMEDKLNEEEYIIKRNDLKINIKDSKIEIEVFFAVYEDITGYQKIDEELEELEK